MWYEKACEERTSSRVTSSVICRRRSGYGKIIRCAPSGPWWTKCSNSCRGALTRWVRQGRAAVDSAGTTVASAVVADAVLDPQRAIADGRDRLQHAVPLVYRIEP